MQKDSIGKRIRSLRKAQGMTQEELAAAVGVTSQAVSKWENDYSCPDIAILPALARTLGVNVDTLLEGETPPDVKTVAGEIVEDADSSDDRHDDDDDDDSADKGYSFYYDARRSAAKGRIWAGIFVAIAGILLILCGLDIITVSFWSILWPTALICIGLSGLARRESAGFHIALLAIGGYFILKNSDLLPEAFSGSWLIPGAILVFCGILMLFPNKRRYHVHTARGNRHASRKTLHCDDGHISYDGSFCSDRVYYGGEILNGGSIDTSFGDFTVDLQDVRSVAEDAALHVDVSFGSLTLLLPTSIRIQEVRDTTFASVNVRGTPAPDAPYILTIHSDVSFGSLDIKYVN